MLTPVMLARILGIFIATIHLAGCGIGQTIAPLGRQLKQPRPLVQKTSRTHPQLHLVRKGESLYAIAWAYNLDYQDIAKWNQIAEPFTIFPGQRLQLIAGAAHPEKRSSSTGSVPPGPRKQSATAKASRTPAVATRHRPLAVKIARKAAKPAVKKATPYIGGVVKKWHWPAQGKLVGKFHKSGGKGINIQGKLGQPIYTAAPGRVVYSGSGLRGYGKLIIIKHNKRFLSAYAHNRMLRVQEGDNVKRGQQIAEMGNTESHRIKLHFEIRRDGKPVNPIRYLP